MERKTDAGNDVENPVECVWEHELAAIHESEDFEENDGCVPFDIVRSTEPQAEKRVFAGSNQRA